MTYDNRFIGKRKEESRLQYAVRLLAATLAIVVIAPIMALTLVLVPAVLVMELPPFLLVVIVGLLAWGLIRLRHGIFLGSPTARHGHSR